MRQTNWEGRESGKEKRVYEAWRRAKETTFFLRLKDTLVLEARVMVIQI